MHIHTPRFCLPVSPYRSAPRYYRMLIAICTPLQSADQTVPYILYELLTALPYRANLLPLDEVHILSTFL